MTAEATDYIGMWYRARARLGVQDRTEFMAINPVTGERRTVYQRHRDADGVGGVLSFARTLGMATPHIPQARYRKPPPYWRRWLGSPKSREVVAPQWRRFGEPAETVPDPVVQWLDTRQTAALYKRAASLGVSVNSLLLLALHRAVSQTLLLHRQAGSWCFPVNMRGSVPIPRQEMNLSSAFYLVVDDNDSPAQVDRGIRDHLKANVHWRYWHLARIGRWIGQRGVNWICGRLLDGPQHLGSLSSLGEWQLDFPSAGLPEDTVFACCGPGSPTHPVANGVAVVNGRMSLALKLHPSLGADNGQAERCLQQWINGLEVAS